MEKFDITKPFIAFACESMVSHKNWDNENHISQFKAEVKALDVPHEFAFGVTKSHMVWINYAFIQIEQSLKVDGTLIGKLYALMNKYEQFFYLRRFTHAPFIIPVNGASGSMRSAKLIKVDEYPESKDYFLMENGDVYTIKVGE